VAGVSEWYPRQGQRQRSTLVYCKSLNERGRLVRSLTSGWKKLPELGKSTLNFEWMIWVEDKKVCYHAWDKAEWIVESLPPKGEPKE
jgi:hypothetical protein